MGIIGAGRLGSALGRRLSTGHEVMFAGRESARDAAAVVGVAAGSNADVAEFADVIVLAVPFAAIEDALADAGPLEGRTLWSCVNALKPDYSGLLVGFSTSAAEEVQRLAAGARVVAALPPFAAALDSGELAYDRGLQPTVFVCGDDDGSKRTVTELVRDIGAEPVDAGSLNAARLVEPAMMLLVSIAYAGAPRDVGLRLLERGPSA